jgi:capsular polysaccharide biosynthesis protein
MIKEELHGDLKVSFFKNADVMPHSEKTYGFYNEGIFVKEDLGKVQTEPKYLKCSCQIEKAIYGGLISVHYGHFILESLSRLWYSSIDKDTPIIFCSRQKKLRPYQEEIFKTLNINNQISIISKPTTVKDLIVPSIGFRCRNYFSNRHADFLSVKQYSQKNRRIWLSRSKLKSWVQRVSNEEILENKLYQEGWEIFHPQDHTVEEQLTVFSEASILSGFVGSAFHTLVLIKDFKGKVIIFNRTKSKETSINENYKTIAKVKQINQKVVQPEIERLGERKLRTWNLLDFSKIIETLNKE